MTATPRVRPIPVLPMPPGRMPPARPAARSSVTPPPVVVRVKSAINPLLRAAFYLFVLSIPFEMPQRSIPIEIPTLTGAFFLLATLIQPSAAYRRIPGALLWIMVTAVVNTEGVSRNARLAVFATLFVVVLIWVGRGDPRLAETVLPQRRKAKVA